MRRFRPLTGTALPLPALLLGVLLVAAGCSGAPTQQEREGQFFSAYVNSLGAAAPTEPAAVAKLRTDSVAYGQNVCTKVSQGLSPDDIASQGGSGATDADVSVEVTAAIQYLCPPKS